MELIEFLKEYIGTRKNDIQSAAKQDIITPESPNKALNEPTVTEVKPKPEIAESSREASNSQVIIEEPQPKKTISESLGKNVKYKIVERVKGGYSIISIDDCYGVIDEQGYIVIPIEYDSVTLVRGEYGLFEVWKERSDKYGLINDKGETILPVKYDRISDFSEGYAVIERNDKYGFVSANGEIIVPCTYSEANDFHCGRASVSNSDQEYGYIDTKGKIVIPLKYYWADDFKEGIACVSLDPLENYGYIDVEGNNITSFEYDDAEYFSEGLGKVKSCDKYGYINKEGEVVIPFKFDDARRFCNGYACVAKGDFLLEEEQKWGIINREGKIVIPLKYKTITDVEDDYIVVETIDGKSGALNIHNEIVIPLEYKGDIWYKGDGIFQKQRVKRVKKGINKKGKTIYDWQFSRPIFVDIYDLECDPPRDYVFDDEYDMEYDYNEDNY